ncbi:hypothetical protein E2C01_099290 [Portunus trituberculatus]|uniref:Uncharacterized protein n=1 Tax=Portunus trituberculatus TaxID=210409 RepID=A0A5B7KEI8_PORTR|nr:hypothetical protein [Portunus trituberculatus]
MKTLALVKQDSGVPENVDSVLEEDTLNLEASSLTKDDKDFKVYMGSGVWTTTFLILLNICISYSHALTAQDFFSLLSLLFCPPL